MSYVVHVYARPENGPMFLVGGGLIEADNEADAEKWGVDVCFDERLRASGCTPYVEVLKQEDYNGR